jgi:serine/threonine protein kinase
MAPEIYRRDYGVQADMWSLGVMLYQLYTQRFPFWPSVEDCKASKLEEVAAAVSDSPILYEGLQWEAMSSQGHAFLEGCLQRDPTLRLDVQQALNHPWLSLHLGEGAEQRHRGTGSMAATMLPAAAVALNLSGNNIISVMA